MKPPNRPEDKDVRWRQRFQSFGKAFTQLVAAARLAEQRPLSPLEQQGLIKAFEFTHELAWNTLKDFLEAHGATNRLFGSKDATREAFATGLIEDGDEWMAMIASRNLTTHTYNEETARTIVESVLTGYVIQFERFEQTMKTREAEA